MGETNLYRLYVNRAEDLPALREQLAMATTSGRSDVLRRAGYDSLSQQARVTGVLDGRCTRLTAADHDAVYDYYRTVQDRKSFQGEVPDDVALLVAAIEDLHVFSAIEQRHSKDGEVIVVGIVRSAPPKGQPAQLVADYVLAQWGPKNPTIAELVTQHDAKVQRLARIRNRVIVAGVVGYALGMILALTVSHWCLFIIWPMALATHLTAVLNRRHRKLLITCEVLFALYMASALAIAIIGGLNQ